MLKNHKNILFSIIIVILVFFGYWYFVLSKKTTPKTTSSSLSTKGVSTQVAGQPTQKSYDKEFVANLQTIQYINLDTTILGSPAYKALSFPERPFQVDYNIPVGRRNPFLPIGIEGSGGDTVDAQVQQDLVPVVTPPATTTPKKR